MKKDKITARLLAMMLCSAQMFSMMPSLSIMAEESSASSKESDSSDEENTEENTDETTRGSADGKTTATPEENTSATEDTEYKTTVHISSVDDFLKFASSAHVSSWSKGKLFVLDNDINLSAATIRVPSFSGTFDGNGHTISGFLVDTGASTAGLFERIESSGLVENLSVEGSNRPQGLQNQIGGIAGVNKGTIKNCSFEGVVDASSQVGGIAGRNEKSGIIQNCTADGSASGDTYVGGIVGYNAGTVIGSTNSMSVNTTYDDSQNTTDAVTDTIDTILTTGDVNSSENVSAQTDTGGVAGYSSGVVESCTNEGNVGYEHVGYNIGGVVGRSSGYMSDCLNVGTVKGRKDVGGVVGQLQPYLRLDFSKGTLGELDTELDTLQSAISHMLNNLDDTNNSTNSTLNKLSDLTGSTTSMVNTMTDQATDDANDAASRVNKAEDVANDVFNGLTDSVNKLKSYTADVSSLTTKTKGSLDTYLAQLELTAEQKKTIKDNFAQLEPIIGKGGPLETHMSNLSTDMSKLSEDYNNNESPTVIEQDVGKVLSDTKDVFADLTKATPYANEILRVLAEAAINAPAIKDSDFYKDMNSLVSKLADMKTLVTDADTKAQQYNSERQGLDLKLRGVNEQVSSTGDDLYNNLDEIGDEVRKLERQVSGGTTTTVNDARKISDASDAIARTLENAMDEIGQDDDEEENVKDESDEEDYTDLMQGRATRCTNHGEIDADNNVGGVAGTVGVEYDLDPEQDIQKVGNASLHYVFSARAVMDKCLNYGDVISKNNCAGGIAGRMDVGLVDYGENYGRVQGGSDYAGGIAGYSEGSVKNSFSKCDVSGEKYVGGIVGFGTKVVDNRAMVTISSADQYAGAIAGRVDNLDNNVTGNLFVSDNLYGIDGVTYDGVASKTTYAKLGKAENMPAEYNTIHVTFLADDEVVDVADLSYGGTLPSEEIPEVPEKDGFFGHWDHENYVGIREDTVVKAIYSRKLSAIASTTKRDGADLLMADGNFIEGDVLEIIEKAPEGNETERWEVSVPIESYDPSDTHTFRYLASDKETDHTKLYLINEDGSRTKLETGTNGNYITFTVSGDTFTFAAETEDPLMRRIRIVAIVAALILIVLIVFNVFLAKKIKKRRALRKDTRTKEEKAAAKKEKWQKIRKKVRDNLD